MKITIRLVNFILIIVGIVLLSISSTVILLALPTPTTPSPLGYEEPYVMLSIGVGLFIGALLGMRRNTKKK